MKEAKLLGPLLPSYPGLIAIVNDIRAKYDLPEIEAEGDLFSELIIIIFG